MASMKEYRLKKETQDIGCGLYQKMVQKECECLGIGCPISDFQLAEAQSFRPRLVGGGARLVGGGAPFDSTRNEAEEKRLFNKCFKEFSNIWKLIEKKPLRANLEHIAREIIETTKINIEDISYNFLKNLMKVYFPEIMMKDIVQIMYIAVKVVGFGIIAYLRNLECLSIAVCKYICFEVCPIVKAMGGWQVLLSRTMELFVPKTEAFTMIEPMDVANYSSSSDPSKAQGCQTVTDYSTPVMIAGILGAIGIGAICIGKAIVSSKRNNN